MAYDWIAWVLRSNIQPAGKKYVIHILASYADQYGFAWAGQDKLALYTSQGVSTVRRHLKELCEDRYLERERRYAKSRGRSFDGFVLDPDRPRSTAQIEQANRSNRADLPLKSSASTAQIEHPYIEDKEQDKDPKGDEGAFRISDYFAKCLDCVGVDQASPGFMVFAEPIKWIEHGCNPELDIYPTIREIMVRRHNEAPSSWRYFTKAILRARVAREEPLTPIDIGSNGRPSSTRAHWNDKGTSHGLSDALAEMCGLDDPLAGMTEEPNNDD